MKSTGRAEVGVHWGDTTEARVTLVAESFGRPHLLADLTEAIALEGVAIVSATVEPPASSAYATPTRSNSRTRRIFRLSCGPCAMCRACTT